MVKPTNFEQANRIFIYVKLLTASTIMFDFSSNYLVMTLNMIYFVTFWSFYVTFLYKAFVFVITAPWFNLQAKIILIIVTSENVVMLINVLCELTSRKVNTFTTFFSLIINIDIFQERMRMMKMVTILDRSLRFFKIDINYTRMFWEQCLLTVFWIGSIVGRNVMDSFYMRKSCDDTFTRFWIVSTLLHSMHMNSFLQGNYILRIR